MSPRRADRLRPVKVLSHLGAMLAVAAMTGVLVAGLAIPFAGVVGLSSRAVSNGMSNLPSELEAEPLAQRTRILAADGSTLATIFDENRVNVSLSDVSPIMRKAIVAIEDYRFYEHGALDLRGTLRAFVTNQAEGGTVQGGSSITQQMVKLTLVNQAKTKKDRAAATAETYQRKFAELRYAIAFEKEYSKDWILERYLNIAYFGDGVHGIEAAAQHYFSKSAAKLQLREAALLAGLVKNPTAYDPTNDQKRAEQRRDTVLERMAELNVISRSEANKAQKKKLGLDVEDIDNGCVSSAAPFFCDYTLQYLLADESLGKTVEDRRRLLYAGGLTIKTTIDLRFQRAADDSIAARVFPRDQAIGGLAVVQPGTGAVRALAQSRPMGANQGAGQTYLNYVVPKAYGDSNGFQAGSTFKVFVLAAAIKQGIPLSTTINSPSSISLPESSFKTCDGNYQSSAIWPVSNSTTSGSKNLYSGTQESVNTFFAQLEQRTGLCEPIRLAREMGVLVPESQEVPSFTLGIVDTDPTTMAGAYATFAARGLYCETRPVTVILDSEGQVIEDYPSQCTQVLSQDVADAVNDILRGVQEPGGFGHGAGLALSQESAGKTGTISENKAVWFVGYTPNMAAAAMIGGANFQGQQITLNGQTVGGVGIYSAAGSTNAGPIWGGAMQVIQSYIADATFTAPNPQTIQGQFVTIPSLGGQSTEAAAAALREAGFNPVIGPTVDSGYAEGTVAYLSPGSGTQTTTGSTVTIYVSDGTPAPPPRNNGGNGGGDNGGGDNGGGGNGGGNGGGGRGRG